MLPVQDVRNVPGCTVSAGAEMLRVGGSRLRPSINCFPLGFTPPLTPPRQGEGDTLANVVRCDDGPSSRPLGVRLRVADVAAGVRLRGGAARPPHRLPALLLHLLGLPPRHAVTAGPGARSR